MTTDDVDEQFAARFAEQFADTWRTPGLAKHEAIVETGVREEHFTRRVDSLHQRLVHVVVRVEAEAHE